MQRRECAVAALAFASAAATALVTRSQAGAVAPSGCTDIQDVPVTYAIEYGAAIQGLFDNFNGMNNGCVDCHFSPDLGTPSGNLDLSAGVSWANLFNVPSAEDASLVYVVPGHPEQSLLFQKVNCDAPGVGARMPLGGYGGGLSAEQQALIYDWIAEGATVATTDTIFRGTFDIRGLTQ
jgi:hypothetical protein